MSSIVKFYTCHLLLHHWAKFPSKMVVSGFACIINLLQQLSHFVEKQYLSNSKCVCRQKLCRELVIIMKMYWVKMTCYIVCETLDGSLQNWSTRETSDLWQGNSISDFWPHQIHCPTFQIKSTHSFIIKFDSSMKQSIFILYSQTFITSASFVFHNQMISHSTQT